MFFVFLFSSQGKQCILSMAERIACLQSECGLSTSVQEFKEQYHFGLVEAVFEWARGMPFSEITNLTDVQEGRITNIFTLYSSSGLFKVQHHVII